MSLGPDHTPRVTGTITVGPGCEINQGVELNPFGGSIRLGRRVWLGPYVVIYGHGGVDIGDHTLISMQATILSSTHAIPSFGKIIRDLPDELRPTKIGGGVWIGANAVVLGGVTIGDGAVVGAGAVVARRVAPGAIVVGVPARPIRQRDGS